MLRRSTSPYFCAPISKPPLKNLTKNYKRDLKIDFDFWGENDFANLSLSMLKKSYG